MSGGSERRLNRGVMKSVAAQPAVGQRRGVVANALQAPVHDRMAREDTGQGGAPALMIRQGLEQIQHPAALGVRGLTRAHVACDCGRQVAIGAQALEMQLRITARQIEAVDRRQVRSGEGREEHQLRSHRPQQVEIRGVEERERAVPRDANAHTRQGALRHLPVDLDIRARQLDFGRHNGELGALQGS
jgi:hypothetical protein